MDDSINIFVISLTKEIDRREAIAEQLRKFSLEFRFFDAVDGKSLTREQLSVCYDRRGSLLRQARPLTPSEIGCSLSHIEVYRIIEEENLDWALIIEDDSLLSENFLEYMECAREFVRNRKDSVVLISECEKFIESSEFALREISVHEIIKAYYTSTYVITNDAARKLSRYLFPVRDVADCWIRLKKFGVIHVYCLNPNGASQNKISFKSNISPDIEDYFKNYLNKSIYKIRRLISILWEFVYLLYTKFMRFFPNK